MKYSYVLEFARSMRKSPTQAEKRFWQSVRNRKFHGLKFNRQYIINYSQVMNQKHYFIVDFYCHKYKLIIELDGTVHKYQFEYDEEREAILANMGYSILRFRNEDVLIQWSKIERKLLECIES